MTVAFRASIIKRHLQYTVKAISCPGKDNGHVSVSQLSLSICMKFLSLRLSDSDCALYFAAYVTTRQNRAPVHRERETIELLHAA